jgi:two-component system, chemotaxis family, protein-glutamate methylesterase/glutaminase
MAKPGRNIVVIGASAGGVQALRQLVRGLPADLPASLFVVVHFPPYAESRLREILNRSGLLGARVARDGEPIVPSRIYIAPVDWHMLIRNGRIELDHGPRENHSRPAIDPLFRSAARTYGSRVVGIILSGELYDGAAGLLAVKSRSGVAVVQDPADAGVESMPSSALSLVDADYVLPVTEMAEIVARMARGEPGESEDTMADDEERVSSVISDDIDETAQGERDDELTIYTCPECGGFLWQSSSGQLTTFHCHVGHAFGTDVLLDQKSEELEGALWACVRLLTERATLTRQVAHRSAGIGQIAMAERSAEQADLDEQRAQLIREMLESAPSPVDELVSN